MRRGEADFQQDEMHALVLGAPILLVSPWPLALLLPGDEVLGFFGSGCKLLHW